MSTLPEAKLAAEAEIAYQVILMSTDYDVSLFELWDVIHGREYLFINLSLALFSSFPSSFFQFQSYPCVDPNSTGFSVLARLRRRHRRNGHGAYARQCRQCATLHRRRVG